MGCWLFSFQRTPEYMYSVKPCMSTSPCTTNGSESQSLSMSLLPLLFCMRCNAFHTTSANIVVRIALLHKAASIAPGNKPTSMAQPDANNDIPKDIQINVPH